MRRLLAVAASVLALTFGLSACSGTDPGVSVSAGPTAEAAPQSGSTVAAEEFAAALKREGTTVLDVRTPQEYAEGHLEGAVNLDIEDPAFPQKASTLDPAGSYAIYCRSGNRSAVAVNFLTSQGFTGVYHLDGGIQAWSDAGGEIVTD